ncbi:hypothetical protein C7S18_09645 [Ahniella affigens]|uniref:DUF5666 domain-containing protein n=1 Tax=Ahniella affigens TaxID=2021234 RepID=A0A2P1PRH1_9GAMM|nr:hypothetical protein [Ahniella affigens]AVP97443.1 hypothetical protein C7S18_09645 [Ahniella affigens]
MNQKLNVIALLFVIGFASMPSNAAVNVDYRNFDSDAHEFTALCSGSRATITFDRNTTSSATLQGSAPCVIKQAADEIILKGGEELEIKNGVIKIVG